MNKYKVTLNLRDNRHRDTQYGLNFTVSLTSGFTDADGAAAWAGMWVGELLAYHPSVRLVSATVELA